MRVNDPQDTGIMISYNCPVKETGHFAMNTVDADLVKIEGTDMLQLKWPCVACGRKHYVILYEDK